MKLLQRLLTSAALTAAFTLPFAAIAQTPAPKTAATTPKAATKTSAPSDAEIADAKTKGLVWVNTGSSTKAYHNSTDKYYGHTKTGKFMTEADAQKGGYHLAKESPIGKKKTKTTTPPATPAK
jgi:hypothetical protein